MSTPLALHFALQHAVLVPNFAALLKLLAKGTELLALESSKGLAPLTDLAEVLREKSKINQFDASQIPIRETPANPREISVAVADFRVRKVPIGTGIAPDNKDDLVEGVTIHPGQTPALDDPRHGAAFAASDEESLRSTSLNSLGMPSFIHNVASTPRAISPRLMELG